MPGIIKIAVCMIVFFAQVAMALDFRAEYSIPADSFKAHFDQTADQGYRLVFVSGYDDASGNVFFNTIWHKNTDSIVWKGYAGVLQSDYEGIFDENFAQGYRPVFIDGYSANGVPYICAIYHLSDGSTSWTSRSLQSSSQYQQVFTNMVDQGFSLDVVSSYQENGALRIASLFSKHERSGYPWIARHDMTEQSYQATFDLLVGQGYSLQYLSVGNIDNDQPRFAAIFSQDPRQFVAFHGITQADMQSRLNSWVADGYTPKVIDCYRTGNDLRWALVLVKNEEELIDPEPNDATFPETSCFDEKITSFMKNNMIPGASVSVMKDGKIVYSQGYGTRDVPGISGANVYSRKVSECTPFRLASLSKPVTSLAILRLVQNGSLAASDKVFGSGGILQRFSDDPKPCCPIVDTRIFDVTVYHLLTHSGGWDRDASFSPMFRSKIVSSTLGIAGPASCENIIYYMFSQPLQHDPGTTYSYSNFGYCILGRVIEEITGLGYEEAVRQLLLDPAGVSRDEMYIGSTQLKDIPEMESEYYCRHCSLQDSIFPAEQNLVPSPYGAWYLEAMDSHGGWVASAPQLMQLLSTTGAPHCNRTITSGNMKECLLWESSIQDLVERPSFSQGAVWYGLGFSVRNAGSDQNWWHTGSLAGTETILVRTHASFGYTWAMLVNTRGFDGSIDSLMWDAVGCVHGNWPEEYESTCDFSPTIDSNPPSTSPSNSPVDTPGPTAHPSIAPVSDPPIALPSLAPISTSNEPSVPPPSNSPSNTISMPNLLTASPTETRLTLTRPSSSPSYTPNEDQSGTTAASSQSNSQLSRCPIVLALLILPLIVFVLS